MPKDTWKNNSARTHPRAGINEMEHAWELEREERKAERKAYYASIRNPRQYWAAVRRNRAIENAKWAEAFKRIADKSTTSGVSALDLGVGRDERSEDACTTTEAQEAPTQSRRPPDASQDAQGGNQPTLF